MPNPDAPPLTRGVVLRSVGFALAIGLGALAVWLIVMADSTKSIQLGVLAGIWGALLGAYSMFGSRRHLVDAEDQPRGSGSDVPVLSAQEIAVRSNHDVERVAEAAARRAFEDRLEQMLRRELTREVSDLRSEIARLRQDLLDKVGGQLRLERIETTRVIGSDLEALHHEVRQLKQASETGSLHDLGLGMAPLRTVLESAKVRPISRASADAAADIKPARSADEPGADPQPDDATPVPPAPVNGVAGHAARRNPEATSRGPRSAPQDPDAPTVVETTGPIRLERPERAAGPVTPSTAPVAERRPTAPTPEQAPVDTAASVDEAPPADAAPPVDTAPPVDARPREVWTPPARPAERPTVQNGGDPFASLPRITPFTEFELDPVDAVAAPVNARPEPAAAAHSGPASPVNPAYTGRRRRSDGDDHDAGRHSRSEAAAVAPDPIGGRRRRAADDADDEDLLSRLLARGSADH